MLFVQHHLVFEILLSCFGPALQQKVADILLSKEPHLSILLVYVLFLLVDQAVFPVKITLSIFVANLFSFGLQFSPLNFEVQDTLFLFILIVLELKLPLEDLNFGILIGVPLMGVFKSRALLILTFPYCSKFLLIELSLPFESIYDNFLVHIFEL